MAIKIVVYDDNRSRQEALKLLLDNRDDMDCVGVFENCSNVEKQIAELRPNVVLMDIDMPEVNGIEGLKRIRKSFPDVLIVMQTIFDEEDKIFEAIRAGAHGYFLKKTPPARLLDGILDVMEGGAPMTSSVARKVLEVFQHQSSAPREQRFDLTEREIGILRMLVKGMSYKMIAAESNITYHTVNSHCKKIYEKLHVHSAIEAVAKAIDHRIV